MVASPEQVGCDVGEEPFDLVDPTGVGRGEMHVEPRMAREPFLHRLGLVGAVVVTHQVDVQVPGNLVVDFGQELLELNGSVAPVHAGDDGAIGGVKRSEQTRCPVADVVMGAFLGHAGHHRERRLGPGQSLDLGLLIYTQDHGGFGRIEIQPDDVVDLVDELRIVGQFEPVSAVRFEVEGLPDPPNRGLGQSAAFGHLCPRPVRRVRRRRFQRGHDHVLNLIGGDHRRTARTRLIDQPIEAINDEAATPLAHRGRRAPQRLRDRRVIRTLGAHQHNL